MQENKKSVAANAGTVNSNTKSIKTKDIIALNLKFVNSAIDDLYDIKDYLQNCHCLTETVCIAMEKGDCTAEGYLPALEGIIKFQDNIIEKVSKLYEEMRAESEQ